MDDKKNLNLQRAAGPKRMPVARRRVSGALKGDA
jgi:hypothetical protein